MALRWEFDKSLSCLRDVRDELQKTDRIEDLVLKFWWSSEDQRKKIIYRNGMSQVSSSFW